jgi:hypothetical protein
MVWNKPMNSEGTVQSAVLTSHSHRCFSQVVKQVLESLVTVSTVYSCVSHRGNKTVEIGINARLVLAQ